MAHLARQLLGPGVFSHSDELVRAWVAVHCVHVIRLNVTRPIFDKEQCAQVFDRVIQEVRNMANIQDANLYRVRFMMFEKLMQDEVYVGMYDTIMGGLGPRGEASHEQGGSNPLFPFLVFA